VNEVSDAQITTWKEEHGSVYNAVMAGQEFIFRSLTLKEFDAFMAQSKKLDSALLDEYIVDMGLLYPYDPDFDNKPAGVVTGLAEEILEYSSFGTPKSGIQVLDEEREQFLDVRGLLKAFIIAGMPAYTEEDLEDLNFRQLAHKVALSEKVLEVQQGALGIENSVRLDLIDPEEEVLKQEQQKKKHAATKKPGQASPDDAIAQKLHAAMTG